MYILVKILEIITMVTISVIMFVIIKRSLNRATSDEVTNKIYGHMEQIISKREDMSRLKKKLVSRGVPYYFKRKDLTPTGYFCIRLIIAFLGAAVGILLDVDYLLCIVIGIVCYLGTDFVIGYMNKKDNEDMMDDIYQLFANLRVQLDAGVYLFDAITNCHYGVKNKRLRKAIDELLTDMSLSSITSVEAVTRFENKFSDNQNIRNLAILFKNYINYGVSEKYLNDIMSEINDMSVSSALKAEHDLDNRTGILNVCFCCLLMAIVVFGMISTVDVSSIFN